MNNPKPWYLAYPQGTPEGDEEQRFFIFLSRSKYKYHSISQISSECHLTKERIEQIISKYADMNIVIQNPKNEDQWGYWEKCDDQLPKKYVSLSQKDKEKRIAEISAIRNSS